MPRSRKKPPPKSPPPKPPRTPVRPPVKKPQAGVSTGTPLDEDIEWFAPEENFNDVKDAVLYKHQIEANIKLLQYKRLAGELIEVNLVEQMKSEASINFRDAFYSLIDRMAPELAALTDPRMVRDYLHQKYPVLIDALEQGWTPPAKIQPKAVA